MYSGNIHILIHTSFFMIADFFFVKVNFFNREILFIIKNFCFYKECCLIIIFFLVPLVSRDSGSAMCAGKI